MSQRPAERPLFTALGQHWQVLANMNAGCFCGDGVELPTHLLGGVWLHVEAVVLPQPTGEENVDERLGAPGLGRVCHCPQRGEMIPPQSKQPDRPGLDRDSPRHAWVFGK